MRIRILIIGVLVISRILHATPQDTTVTLSLKQSCLLGIDKNLNVQNAGLDQQKMHYQFKEAQSKLFPHIEGYSNFSYYYAIPQMVLPGEIFGQTGMIAVEIGTKYDWTSGFKASQILYNQSYFTALQIAKKMETLGELNFQQKKEEAVFQVSQVYYLCQTTKYQVAQLQITMQNTDKLIDIAKLQNENGVIRRVDYARVSVNKANLQTQMDNLMQLYQQQLGLLKYLIGLNINSKVELSDSLMFAQNITSYELPDFNKRTELEVLDKQLEVTALNRKLDQQTYLPSIAGFGQYYYEGQRNEFDFLKGGNDKFYKVGVVGLSLNVPIFSGFERQFKVRQKDIELLQLQNTRKATSEFLSKEYTDAVLQYQNSINALLRQQGNIEIAEDVYNTSLQGYRQQVTSLSDLLMSESSLVEARLSYFNALLQLKNAELLAKKAKGELMNF